LSGNGLHYVRQVPIFPPPPWPSLYNFGTDCIKDTASNSFSTAASLSAAARCVYWAVTQRRTISSGSIIPGFQLPCHNTVRSTCRYWGGGGLRDLRFYSSVDLYVHSPIRLHGVSTGDNFTFLLEVTETVLSCGMWCGSCLLTWMTWYPEDDGSTFFRNADKLIPDYTSYPGRQYFSNMTKFDFSSMYKHGLYCAQADHN
jgi:hypothetical protein